MVKTTTLLKVYNNQWKNNDVIGVSTTISFCDIRSIRFKKNRSYNPYLIQIIC